MSSMSTMCYLVKITNPKKLVGKPVAMLAKIAKSVSSDVFACINDKQVSAKNLGTILSLAPKKDDILTIYINDNSELAASLLEEMVNLLIETDVAEKITESITIAESKNESVTADSTVASNTDISHDNINDDTIHNSDNTDVHTIDIEEDGIEIECLEPHEIEIVAQPPKAINESNKNTSTEDKIKASSLTIINHAAVAAVTATHTTHSIDKNNADINLLDIGNGQANILKNKTVEEIKHQYLYTNDFMPKENKESSSYNVAISINTKPTKLNKLQSNSTSKPTLKKESAEESKVLSISKIDTSKPTDALSSDASPVVNWSDFILPTKASSLAKVNNTDIKLETKNPVDDSADASAIPLSAGMALAPAFIAFQPEFDYESKRDNTALEELNTLQEVLEQAKSDLDRIIYTTDFDDIQTIFKTQRALLEDEQLLNNLMSSIAASNLPIATIWAEHIDKMASEQVVQNQFSTNIRDVGNRVLKLLCNVNTHDYPDYPHIIISQEVLPSDIANMDTELVAGILTAENTATDSAILARALGVPMVVNAGNRILDIENDVTLIVNGETGDFIIDPNKKQIETAKRNITKQVLLSSEAIKRVKEPANTIDGHHIKITAGINTSKKITLAIEEGTDCIGLFTLEDTYDKFQELPTLEEQTDTYHHLFTDLQNSGISEQPLTIQLLNVNPNSNRLPYLQIPYQNNPLMGISGIRFSLRQSAFFKSQLLALFNANSNKQAIKLVLPMISQIDEWRMANRIIKEALDESPCDDLQIGIMVELPSVALTSHIFAIEADFFCINIDNLAQYTLATDHNHPILAQSADLLHPSVLSLIDLTIYNAHQQNKAVSIYSTLTHDIEVLPLFIGMGVDEIIIHPSDTAKVKAHIRMHNFSECQEIKNEALSCESGFTVRELIKSRT